MAQTLTMYSSNPKLQFIKALSLSVGAFGQESRFSKVGKKNYFLGSRSKTTEKFVNLKALWSWQNSWSTILYLEGIFFAKKMEVFPAFSIEDCKIWNDK